MKRALLIADSYATSDMLDFKWVANSHDEMQAQVAVLQADTLGKLCLKAIQDAGKYYKMRCPLDAEYKVGKTWAETH